MAPINAPKTGIKAVKAINTPISTAYGKFNILRTRITSYNVCYTKLLRPHVVGNAVGLPALWVLVAVTIGGSMMGITGMLFFIPLVSVLYALFRELVYSRLQKRGIQQKLPESNEEGPGDGIVPAIQEDLSKGEQPADASVRTPDKGETSQSKMGSGVGSRRSGMQRKSKKK